jgi:TrmH family RNA methyltransferase
VEGASAVEQVILHQTQAVESVVVSVELQRIPRFAKIVSAARTKCEVMYATRNVVNSVSEDAQGIFAIIRPKLLEVVPTTQRKEKDIVLILNNIQDPGNAGSIIRAAAAFGVSRVMMTQNSVDWQNPKVIRSSVGAVFQVPVYGSCNLADSIDFLRGERYHIIATDLRGTDIIPARPLKSFVAQCNRIALIFGNEAHGLTTDEINQTDACLYIEIDEHIESLNVAGAAQIFLYHFS